MLIFSYSYPLSLYHASVALLGRFDTILALWPDLTHRLIPIASTIGIEAFLVLRVLPGLSLIHI